ncbi:MAG: hypothetical protein RSD88_05275 [Anaerovoracaceae bacterium]
MIVKQMSVFVENTTGRLSELTEVLAKYEIDIKAMCIADTVDFGILRCIVSDADEATRELKKNGFTASITEVIAVELNDHPGGLDAVLKVLCKEDIAVDYIYSTIRSSKGKALIIIKVADPRRAIEVLTKAGVVLHCIDDLM